MNDKINIKRPGQILDYVDTKEHLVDLFNYITNLQSNWNNLREWLKDNPNVALYGDGKDFKTYIELQKVLDKMNELEGVKDK